MADLTVLLPAYNEEKTIGGMIDEIRCLPIKCDILVADSESTDRTAEIAKGKGVLVVKGRRGKGNTVRGALRHVRTPYVVMLDADGTYPVEAIPGFCDMLEDGFDVVKGNRVLCEDGSMPRLSRFGNRGISFVASALFWRMVADVDSGMWAFREECLKNFDLTSERFTLEVDLFTNAVRNKCNMLEIPIKYRARPSGSRAKIHLRDWLEIGWFLLRRRFEDWTLLGIFSFVLVVDGVWSIAIQLDEPFIPYQLGRMARIGIAVCVGLIAWSLRRRQEGAHSADC